MNDYITLFFGVLGVLGVFALWFGISGYLAVYVNWMLAVAWFVFFGAAAIAFFVWVAERY